MAEANRELSTGATGRGDLILGRLAEAGWLLAALATFLIVLGLAGIVSFGAVAILLAGAVILAGLVPRANTAGRPARRAEATAVVWPETPTKLFAEALPDPCFVLDQRGVVRYANRRAVEAFSIRTGESLTFRLRVPDLVAAFDRVAKGGGPERVEFHERVPTERWFAGWFSRLDSGGSQPFIALILDDMTERRRSERIRVDFVANASHELRTPLASLSGFIETLQGPARDDTAARQRFLKIMQDQAMRMTRLVDDLLSLSRIEMKAHVRPSGAVDLVALLRHVTDALEPLASELGITLEVVVPKGTVTVVGDRDELIQVFENLIENACKYGQSGKRVEVSVISSGDGDHAVAVRDFGPGIAEEHIPRLTERFYRIDVESSRRHRGTGLGLAIVKHILARHQARLQIESRLGEGATFRVNFPQAQIIEDLDRPQKGEIDQTLVVS
jgi:two-component system, OmpR family, phosphate regulon sensor histidine kinase PhoR